MLLSFREWSPHFEDQNNGGKASDFALLYRIPGMPHGAGGPSYDDFDFFSPLVAWVEQGAKPESIAAGVRPEGRYSCK